ncbi:MAG: transglycosylase SLT domain-containing protein [Streptosporangiales bacterium]|nr:transglycosylase SLT domain-containing protein [Streptosporangiales bacterium]
MINAPGGNHDALGLRIRRMLGPGTQIIDMHKQAAGPSGSAPTGRSRSYLDLYKRSAARCDGLSWTVLAAIGQIESGHGRNNGPSTAGALGPMQFMPATWRSYGMDGDGDRRADIQNPYDAVPSASRYLCANGAGRGGKALYTAVWRYNHSDEYVRQVLGLAQAYARAYR